MQPPRFVNDFTGLLNYTEQNQLERKLQNYYDTTSTQIAIATVADLQGYDIADYAIQLFNKWGIGKKDKNNGLLILIKPKYQNSRGEIFIVTGYGLEGAIPDAYAKRVISQNMEPAFAENKYYQGLDDATTTLMQMAAGEYKSENDSPSLGGIISTIVLILLLIFIISRGGGGGLLLGSLLGGLGGGGGSSGGFGGFGGGRSGGGGARGGW